jgi:hypothetical protein
MDMIRIQLIHLIQLTQQIKIKNVKIKKIKKNLLIQSQELILQKLITYIIQIILIINKIQNFLIKIMIRKVKNLMDIGKKLD